MKAKLLFLLFLMMLLQTNMGTHAMELKTWQKIALKDRSKSDTSRSIPILPTAFIDGSLLSIDFPPIVSRPIIITVRNVETGEIVYSDTVFDADTVVIDLADKVAGKYTLEILFDATTLSGDFIL